VQCYFVDQNGGFFDPYSVFGGNVSGHDDKATYQLTSIRSFPNPPNTIKVVCGSYDRASNVYGEIHVLKVNPLGVK
jgi:hypothetical protein